MAEMMSDEDAARVVPDSLCTVCGGAGETRVLTRKVPHFRELVVSSFACGSCGATNDSVDYKGERQPKGVAFALTCAASEDLGRTVVKSDTAIATIPHLDLVIPSDTMKGVRGSVTPSRRPRAPVPHNDDGNAGCSHHAVEETSRAGSTMGTRVTYTYKTRLDARRGALVPKHAPNCTQRREQTLLLHTHARTHNPQPTPHTPRS